MLQTKRKHAELRMIVVPMELETIEMAEDRSRVTSNPDGGFNNNQIKLESEGQSTLIRARRTVSDPLIPECVEATIYVDYEKDINIARITSTNDGSCTAQWDDDNRRLVKQKGDSHDSHGPKHVCVKVKMVIRNWGPVAPISPERFFMKLLLSRGHQVKAIPALSLSTRKVPSTQQITDYDTELVHAVRTSNIGKLQTLCQAGRSMSACNRFSESIVHMACRRSNFEVAEYILGHGGDSNIVDDFGRTPLHDACWRIEPRFDIVTLLLDRNIDLLRTVDIRGATPLKYIRSEHWLQWCAYLFHQKDKYWVSVGDPAENLESVRRFCCGEM